MKRVVITGVTTPYGAALVKCLLAQPEVEQVWGVGREEHHRMIATKDERFRYCPLDLTRSRDVRTFMWGAARGADTLLHAAVHRSVRQTGRRVHQLNVGATRSLVQLAEEHPTLKQLVFKGSGLVYASDTTRRPTVVDERQALNLDPAAPQWIRDRVAADLSVCSRMNMSPLRVIVMRCAEVLAPDMGSQLYDYLQAPVCITPLGFDPMVEVLSVADLVAATCTMMRYGDSGVFNVAGYDRLPLSQLVAAHQRRALKLPDIVIGPLYRLRAALDRGEFHYALNRWRFHFNTILSGLRSNELTGYAPAHSFRDERKALT